MHGITTLAQIQNPDTMGILTPVEFQTRYKQISKAIKTALQQAQTLFPTPPPSTPHTNRPLPPQNINTNTTTTLTPSTQPTLGCAIHNIIQDKTTIRKDKWGAQAIKRSYLCQWRTHNETTQQWRTEENLLHPDNILLDHNLLLITQYHKTKTEHETTQLYKDYTHHSQSKDNKFIHPPLKITNLKISTQERNPDKDIHANKPTIQIQNSMANIHDQNGNYIATLTIERLQWLWNQFSQNNLPHLTPFLQPPPQDFETEILWLLQRYITILPKKKPKNISPTNLHHTLHPDINKVLIESFKITHTYHATPLTCPTQLTQYNSPHTRDIIFGSMGHTKSSRWKGTGLAFPKDHKSTLEAIHWARMAAKEDEHTTTILIVNYKDWTTQQLPLKDHADIHIIATIPPHTIQYVPTPEWPKYY